MLPGMEPNPEPKTVRLNVSLEPKLHRDLRTLSVQANEPLTQLVPRLLRAAVKAELERLAQQ